MTDKKKKILIAVGLIIAVAVPVSFIIYLARLPARPPSVVISGLVTDAAAGQPIAGAKVWDEYGAQRSAITDSDGKYSYSTSWEEHNIAAQASGYKVQRKGLITYFWQRETKKIMDFALVSE